MSDLPPLDQQQAYVVVGSNEQVGPYALELLISEVVAGRLADTTPVWWPPLADWTTMSMHPGVAGEIARRRAATGSAPAWAAPSASPYDSAPGAQPFAEPAHTESAQEETASPAQAEDADSTPASAAEPATADSYAAAPSAASVFDTPTVFESSRGSMDAEIVDAEIVDAGVVEAGVVETVASEIDTPEPIDGEQLSPEALSTEALATEAVVLEAAGQDEAAQAEAVEDLAEASVGAAGDLVDDSTRATFNALVERSSRRADSLAKVEAVDELFVNEVIASATSLGFGIDDRTDVDRRHELRFGEQSGNLLVISLGRILSQDPDQIRATALPVTISYRADSGAAIGSTGTATTDHGEVVVTPDEWTGQTTSSVSLFLSAEDYLTEDLVLAGDSLNRDIAAVIKVVRARIA